MAKTAELCRSTVQDAPTDWPEELNELRILDNLLRCSICLEYFDIAVLATGCCHNYCSLCARKYITFKAQCPSCPAEMHPKDLKCNRVLDEIVKVFNILRPKLLKILKEHSELLKRGQKPNCSTLKSPYTKAKSTKSKDAPDLDIVRRSGNIKQLNQKSTEYNNSPSDDDFDLQRNLNLNPSTEFLSGSSTTTLNESDIESSNDNDNLVSMKRRSKDFAICPVCGKKSPLKQINSHLDICLSINERQRTIRSRSDNSAADQSSSRVETRKRHSSKRNCTITKVEKTEVTLRKDTEYGDFMANPNTSSSKIKIEDTSDDRAQVEIEEKLVMKRTASNQLLPTETTEKRKKHPELVLGGLTDKQMRAKLKSHGLSSRGDKKTLQNRLKSFILLYNSQCDAVNPMPDARGDGFDPSHAVSDIVKEVERGESIRKRLETKGTIVIHTFDRTKTDEDKEKFTKNYLEKHKTHFDQLIQDVKNRRKNEKSNGTKDISYTVSSSSNSLATGNDSALNNSQECFENVRPGRALSDEERVPALEAKEHGITDDYKGSPTKPILIFDEDERIHDQKDKEIKPNQSLEKTSFLFTPSKTPKNSDRSQALSSKLRAKLESSVGSKGKKSESGSRSKSTTARPTASQSKTASKSKSKSNNGRKRKIKAQNITSFFEKTKQENSDVSFIENPKRISEVEISSDSSNKKQELSSDEEMMFDETGNPQSTTEGVNERQELIANPPSPSELDLFDNQYSETMMF